ncbi:MAG: DUF2070 family protein [Thermoplasmatales archaeon]|nr:DUF2070 family protein [Thermoplasmatales archaeon]
MGGAEKTARLIRFVFSSPKPWKTCVLIIVFSIFFGLIVTTEKGLLNIIKYSILIFAFPAFLSGMLSKPLTESLGGLFYLRRSMLLSFVCLLIIGFISTLGFLFNKLPAALIFGYSSVIWLRHIVLLGTSNPSHIRSFPGSVSQTVLGFIFSLLIFPAKPFLWAGFTAIFLFSVIILVETAKIPMKKSFGFNGLELLKYALAHLTDSSLELESFFEANGEEINAEVGVISFRNKKGVIKAAVVVPGIHPGPFGTLGGSNLPSKIAKKFEHPVLVLHSASTHDLNPVSSEQCRKIADAVRLCVKEADYVLGGSKLVKKSSKSEVFTQFFGNTPLIMHSPLKPTDDIDVETGKAAVLGAGGNAFFVDAHNTLEEGADSVVFGSPVSKDIIRLAENAVSSAKENRVESMRVGVSSERIESDDVGKQGVQVLAVEAGKQRTAYLLWDGNNMLKGVREDIAEKLGDIVDDSVILTTDNHSVNITMDGFNPVGSSIKNPGIISRELVREAVNDLEEVRIGVDSRTIRIKVAGRGNTEKLTAAVNSTMHILKYAAPASLWAGVSACMLISLFIL